MKKTEYPKPFGEYLLLDQINTGGMAEVCRAKAYGVEGFERIVAIKRILPHLAKDESFAQMFVDEARIAVQLSNPHIVQIYELGVFEGQYYIVMEYVHGLDLKRTLRQLHDNGERLPLPHVIFLTSCVCAALDFAHRKCDLQGEPLNIVHRDVSPHNVLISFDGAAKVTDFGIAKAEHRITQTEGHMLKGKFPYMSPEQVRGKELDHRSDVYSTGSLLWEMLTGEQAFSGLDNFEILEQVRQGDVEPPSTRRPHIPPALDEIVLKAMAPDRDERYQWASELLDDLEQLSLDRSGLFTHQKMASYMRERFAGAFEKEKRRTQNFLGADEAAVALIRGMPRARASSKTQIFASKSFPMIPEGRPAEDPDWTTSLGVDEVCETTLTREAYSPPESPEPAAIESPPSVEAERSTDSPATQIHPTLLAASAGAFLISCVLLVAVLVRNDVLSFTDSESPQVQSTTGSAIPDSRGDLSHEDERTPDEPPESHRDIRKTANARRAFVACRRELSTEMGDHGIIAGDLPRVDAQRAKMESLADRSMFVEAGAACKRGLTILSRVDIDKKFVLHKLARFNKAFDRSRPQVQSKLARLAESITGAINARDFHTANRLLNSAFAQIRSEGRQ
ncbi:serine/threonine protein kinase [Myxococcota bacterium]